MTLTGSMIVVMALATLLSCSPADREGDVASPAKLEEISEAAEEGTSQFLVSQGAIKGVEIGAEKASVARSLVARKAAYVWPAPRATVVVHVGDDLEPLRNAEKIVIGSGEISITFHADKVSSVDLSPSVRIDESAVRVGESRAEVLSVLPTLMESVGARSAHNAVALGGVNLQEVLPLRDHPLWLYDDWVVHLREPDGLWRLQLHFRESRLASVSVVHSTFELP